MPGTKYANIDEYIGAQPAAVQPVLERVRGIIRKAVPGVEEAVSYGIPTFRLHGTYVVYLAGYKKHFSLHPVTDGLLAALGDELAPHLAGKGTMRFALSERVPTKLIERIAKVRAKEVAGRAKTKAAATKRSARG
jgi:uncharacterized protein YdhG (YjbR/CyaY superfamily)